MDAYWSYNSNSSIQSVREWPKIVSHLRDRLHEEASKGKEKKKDMSPFQLLFFLSNEGVMVSVLPLERSW